MLSVDISQTFESEDHFSEWTCFIYCKTIKQPPVLYNVSFYCIDRVLCMCIVFFCHYCTVINTENYLVGFI